MLETSPIASPEGKDFGCLVLSRDGGDIFDISPKEVVRLFKRHGAILFRGFRMEGGDTFRAFSDKFGRDYVTYPGVKRDPVSADSTVQTAVKGEGSISLHQEMSYLPFPFCPDFCAFYCMRPPVVNGQTIMCDGAAVVPFVSRSARRLLESQPLKYEMKFTVEQCLTFLRTDSLQKFTDIVGEYSLNDVFTLTEDGVRTSYKTPAYTPTKFGRKKALVKPLNNFGRAHAVPVFADGAKLPGDLYDELEDITGRLTVDINWQQGDVLLFDNTRVMHGRRTVDDDQRLIYTRFGKNNFN
jgi:alpha-ketoglutarate-dependent taurine dioxygenase